MVHQNWLYTVLNDHSYFNYLFSGFDFGFENCWRINRDPRNWGPKHPRKLSGVT